MIVESETPKLSPAAQAAQWSTELEGRSPQEVVAWAIQQFGDGLVIGSSFGKDSLVVIDMAQRSVPDIPVLFLETGYHFPETLEFRDRLRNERHVNIVDVYPTFSVEEQDAQFGPNLFARDPDQCCAMRKVFPLQVALRSRRAWMTGLRRTQHEARAKTPVVEWQELDPDGHGVFKVNPVIAWTLHQVDDYVTEHHLLTHPLLLEGYRSVGCAPCTRKSKAGDGERSGRWAGTSKVECGIHVIGVRHSVTAKDSSSPA
jgi:phosphoadenosine phosphosulfate reductase